ncbi:MAG: hypothetical protein RSE39_08660, partial [Oscillospiraceae bacterium]
SNDKPLNELLHNDKYALEPCKKWLLKFPKWNDFVEQNYLLSFVNGKGQDKKYQLYQLLAFWNGHSFGNENLPADEKVFCEFLKLLNKCIINRNIEIREALKK